MKDYKLFLCHTILTRDIAEEKDEIEHQITSDNINESFITILKNLITDGRPLNLNDLKTLFEACDLKELLNIGQFKILCDINQDGQIDIRDLIALKDKLTNQNSTVELPKQTFTHITHRRVLEIGASTNLSSGRAYNIEFYTKIDGTHELTFELPQIYFDETVGDNVHNPLVDYIGNKAQLELEIEGKSYFMTLNIRTEEKQGGGTVTYRYECTDTFIEELSKNGYGIVFSDDIEGNGLGTIHEFSNYVVAGTEWIYDEEKTGTLYEYEKGHKWDSDKQVYVEVRTPIPVHKVKYVPELKRYCDELKYFRKQPKILNGTDTETYHKVYAYEDTVQISTDSLKNFLYNAKDFVDPVGWVNYIIDLVIPDGGQTKSRADEGTKKTPCFIESVIKSISNIIKNDDEKTSAEFYLEVDPAPEKSEGIFKRFLMNEASQGANNVIMAGQPYVFKWEKAESSEKVNIDRIQIFSEDPRKNTSDYFIEEKNDEKEVIGMDLGNASYEFSPTGGFAPGIYYVIKTDKDIKTPFIVFTLNSNEKLVVKDFQLFPVISPALDKDGNIITTQEKMDNVDIQKTKEEHIKNIQILKNGDIYNPSSVFNQTRDTGSLVDNVGKIISTILKIDNAIEEQVAKLTAFSYKTRRYFIRDNYKSDEYGVETKIKERLFGDTVTYVSLLPELGQNGDGKITAQISLKGYYEALNTKFVPIGENENEIPWEKTFIHCDSHKKLEPNITIKNIKPEKDDPGESSKKFTISIPVGNGTQYIQAYETTIYLVLSEMKYYQYYSIDVNENTGTKWDYAFYDEGYNDKRRTLSLEKSNRFNIIQELAELFRVWPVFEMYRDEKGETIKKFWFKEKCINQNFSGFHEGINIESLSRTIDTNNIVTKMYVEDQENSYAEDGFVTIRTAESNPWGENYYYDFRYYVNQELVDGDIIETDKEQLYQNVKPLNIRIRELNEDIINAKSRANDLKAKLETLAMSILSTIKEIFTVGSISLGSISINGAYDFVTQVSSIISGAGGIAAIGAMGVAAAATQLLPAIGTALGAMLGIYDARDLIEAIIEKVSQFIKLGTLVAEAALVAAALLILQGYIEKWSKEVDEKQKRKKYLIQEFENKYSQFIKEGVWADSSYIENEKYYLDSLDVMDTSAMPQTEWSISVIEGSFTEDLEGFKFEVGDQTALVDKDFLTKSNNGQYIDVLITGIRTCLDQPVNDVIEVRNYLTSFEDIFQRISAATQTLELKEQVYDKASYFTVDGQVDETILQKSLKENALVLSNASDNSYILDNKGLFLQSIDNPTKKLRVIADGIFISNSTDVSGNENWVTGITADGINASMLTTGEINTSVIKIFTGGMPAFTWTNLGITAYKPSSAKAGYATSDFTRFDNFGIYSVKDKDIFTYTDNKPWFEGLDRDICINNIIENSMVSITDYGFHLNVQKGKGSITLGYFDDNKQNYGLRINDLDGKIVVQLQNDGENKISNWTINETSLSFSKSDSTTSESGEFHIRVPQYDSWDSYRQDFILEYKIKMPYLDVQGEFLQGVLNALGLTENLKIDATVGFKGNGGLVSSKFYFLDPLVGLNPFSAGLPALYSMGGRLFFYTGSQLKQVDFVSAFDPPW